jgi:hypothetical protein
VLQLRVNRRPIERIVEDTHLDAGQSPVAGSGTSKSLDADQPESGD